MKMPMSSDTKLTKDEKSESVDNIKYRGMIDDPKTSHLEEVKRIFRYIKGTTHLGLWYPKGPVVYVESDHAGYYVDRKSTSSICTFMGCFLTSWFIKKQTALAISTTEAEYVSAEKAGQSVFTTEWSLEALATYQEPSGPYHTKLPTPDVSHQYLQFERIEPSRVIKGSIKEVVTETMTKPTLGEYRKEVRADYGSNTTTPGFNKNAKFKLGGEFLKILRDNAFNGTNGNDVVGHTKKVLAILELIKLRLHVFPLSLTGGARKWWMDEEDGKITT
ncbi:hypothetical protein Tco_0417642 [Tanacetum coccineum]